MTLKQCLAKEKYVIIRGQTLRFRVIKYCILAPMLLSIYVSKGWNTVGVVLLILFAMGIIVHFFFRWKTKAWAQSWGPYKKMDLPE